MPFENPKSISIEHFEDAIFEDDNLLNQKRSLRFLRSAYRFTDLDLQDLRDFYLVVASQHENPRMVFEAGRQNVLTLSRMGDLEGMIDLLFARRNTLENRVDSLINEIDLLKAQNTLARRNVSNFESMNMEIARIRRLMHGTENTTMLIPKSIVLSSVYPNPFNNVTRIAFSLNERIPTNVSVFDVNGRLVETLLNGYNDPGLHDLIWNAENNGAGVYFIRLNTDEVTQTKTVNLVK